MFLLASQCKSCDSVAIRFKLFNKFEIDKTLLVGLTCGATIAASAYLIYRIHKFNKNLNQSINSINTLTQRFEYIIIDLTHIDEARIGATERILNKKQTSHSRSIVLTDVSPTTSNFKPQRSMSSSASMSDYYETPLTSPHGSSSENESDNGNEEDDEQEFKDPIEDEFEDKASLKPLKSVLKNRKVEDNILVLFQQSVDSLKELVKKNELDINEDETNFDKLIEYIKSLFALAERVDGDFNFVKETHFKCRDLAMKCLDLDNKTYISHKWCAITIGRVIEYLGLNDKIKASVDFKKHLDVALELNENDYYLLYMRGRWAYGICNLNRVQKYAVKMIYGEMPSCTMTNALEDFLKVERLYPKKFKGNLLYLAKCNIHFNDIKKGVENLKDSLRIQCKTTNDFTEHEEVNALLDKYSKKVE